MSIEADLDVLVESGMLSAYYAAAHPNDIAIRSELRTASFGSLNERANRLAAALARHGIGAGDAVAIVSPNRVEFIETYLACLRTGLTLTPVSPRLRADEASYIVADCGARVLIVAGDAAADLDVSGLTKVAVKLAFGSDRRGFTSYEALLAQSGGFAPEYPQRGRMMFYTSGTTGRPKGVLRSRSAVYRPQGAGTLANYQRGDVNLLCGPAYHSASFYYDIILPLASGVPIVLMEKFEPLRFMELVAAHRVTHTHMVPTMFHRLLKLPPDVRGGYDLSSLRVISHGGAPTPVDTKRAMIEWLGPIFNEYYASTEGSPGIRITSEEWLRKPGSVGRIGSRSAARIIDEAGAPCPPGVVGEVFLKSASDGSRAIYHRNPDETRRVLSSDYFTVGDRGYLDSDGYLFLTGRTADRIISGGVNIDPQEIDNIILTHPSVRECCCVGVPNEEWGEEVKAIVVADCSTDNRERLSQELIERVKLSLAQYKAPRSVEFVESIPQTEAGKIQRNVVRARYWRGRALAI